jgi:hypothetical protein
MSIASVPVSLLALGVGFVSAKAIDIVLPENYVVLRNDTSSTVSVQYCVKQDCGGAGLVMLRPGQSHHYSEPRADPTPDEVRITGPGSPPRCDLVDSNEPGTSGPIDMNVSEADPEVC